MESELITLFSFREKLQAVATLFASSTVIYLALVACKQQWVRTFSHTTTLYLLPVITYAITSVISGNIALSLGMVGALSIIRFRNPVRSPFELVVYFLMITCGIAASVNLGWLITLVASVVAVLALLGLVNRLMRTTSGAPLFQPSFTEANPLHVLEVVVTQPSSQLHNAPELVNFLRQENRISYRFASHDRARLMAIADSVDKDPAVEKMQFTAA